jgi:hypothetical protein
LFGDAAANSSTYMHNDLKLSPPMLGDLIRLDIYYAIGIAECVVQIKLDLQVAEHNP